MWSCVDSWKVLVTFISMLGLACLPGLWMLFRPRNRLERLE